MFDSHVSTFTPKSSDLTLNEVDSATEEGTLVSTEEAMELSISSLFLHSIGLILTYSIYALLQEKIIKGEYDGTQFTSSSLLVLFNRVITLLFTLLILLIKSTGQRNTFTSLITPKFPLRAYITVALCNFLSTFCQYESREFFVLG